MNSNWHSQEFNSKVVCFVNNKQCNLLDRFYKKPLRNLKYQTKLESSP